MGIGSCNKSTLETQAPNKVDMLLTELKKDPEFLNYLNEMNGVFEVIKTNVLQTDLKDTSVINDKSLSYAQKSKKLNFQNDKLMYAHFENSDKILQNLIKKHPLYLELSSDENKLLYKKAIAFYTPSRS